MTEIQNPKQKNNVFVYGPEGTGYKFEICNLFGICLPAGFLAGCFGFVILEQNSKTEPQFQHPLFLPSETFFYFIGTTIPLLHSSITPLLQFGRSP